MSYGEYPPPGGYPPGGQYVPGDAYGPPPGGPPVAASPVRGRVTPAAIALIVVGILNLLMSLWPIAEGILLPRVDPKLLEEQMRQQQPGNVKQIEQMGWSVQDVVKVGAYFYLGWGLVAFFASPLIIFGGVQMLRLKSYGLAIFAAILACIPFVSCNGCCGVGEGIGIWSFIVLMNPEVRAAFRGGPPPGEAFPPGPYEPPAGPPA